MKQNMGRTALMLSGGGAQAMYHLGTMRALIESNVYDDIKVISGTSGGSITAACCAMYTAKEMYEDICLSTISTDFRLNGEMKRKKIAWFPPVMDMVAYWLKRRLLVDSKVCAAYNVTRFN
jgi:predicted acylesterase/phospholipase RssA